MSNEWMSASQRTLHTYRNRIRVLTLHAEEHEALAKRAGNSGHRSAHLDIAAGDRKDIAHYQAMINELQEPAS